MILPILIVSLTPGIFWLWFSVRKDNIRPEPRRLIAFTFLLGCLSAIPAAIGNFVFGADMLVGETPALATVFTAMLLFVGPVEEFCKFVAVRLGPYRSPNFDEAVDGLVYSSAASLGFASLENLFYVIQFGPSVMLLRAPLSTVGHLAFGSTWGLALGQHYVSGGGGGGHFSSVPWRWPRARMPYSTFTSFRSRLAQLHSPWSVVFGVFELSAKVSGTPR